MNSTWKNSFYLLIIIIIVPGAVSSSPSKEVPDFKYDCAQPNMFNCISGGDCVPEDHRCDGEPDCEDHSDEAGPCQLCPAPHMFVCGGECQTKMMQCDGQQDCRDNEDEYDCCNILSEKEKFTREDGTCINKTLVCNRKDFWQGGSAEVEEICGTTTVPSATYAPIDVSSEITSQQPNSTPPSLKTPPGGPVNETTNHGNGTVSSDGKENESGLSVGVIAGIFVGVVLIGVVVVVVVVLRCWPKKHRRTEYTGQLQHHSEDPDEPDYPDDLGIPSEKIENGDVLTYGRNSSSN